MTTLNQLFKPYIDEINAANAEYDKYQKQVRRYKQQMKAWQAASAAAQQYGQQLSRQQPKVPTTQRAPGIWGVTGAKALQKPPSRPPKATTPTRGGFPGQAPKAPRAVGKPPAKLPANLFGVLGKPPPQPKHPDFSKPGAVPANLQNAFARMQPFQMKEEPHQIPITSTPMATTLAGIGFGTESMELGYITEPAYTAIKYLGIWGIALQNWISKTHERLITLPNVIGPYPSDEQLYQEQLIREGPAAIVGGAHAVPNLQLFELQRAGKFWGELYAHRGKPVVVNPDNGEVGYWSIDARNGWKWVPQGQEYTPGAYPAPEQPGWEAVQGYIPTEEWRRKRWYDFQRIISNPDGSVNWKALFGSVDPHFADFSEAIYNSTGISGLAYTFALHPERFNDLVTGLDADQDLNSLLMKLEDPWAEALLNTLTDPTLVFAGAPLIGKAMDLMFYVTTPLGYVGSKVAGWGLAKVFRQAISSSGSLLRSAAKNEIKLRGWFFDVSKRSQHMLYTNYMSDAMQNLAIRYIPDVDPEPVEFFQRMLLGDVRVLNPERLASQQIEQIQDGIALLKETTGSLDINEILEKYGSFAEVPPVGKKNVIKVVLEGADDPTIVAKYLTDAMSDQYAKQLGIKPLAKGSLARSLDWSARLLRENWLAANVRYFMNNGSDNVSHTVISHYTPTFDLNSTEKIALYLLDNYKTAIPSDIAKVLVTDALDLDSPLATSALPWPIGYPEGFAQTGRFIFGKNMPDRLYTFLTGKSKPMELMRKVSYAGLLKKGFNFSAKIERSARANIFIQAFESYMVKNIRPDVAEFVRTMPGGPESLVGWIMNGRIKNADDFDTYLRLLGGYGGEPQVEKLLSDLMPPGTPETDFFRALQGRLDAMSELYKAAWGSPDFQARTFEMFINARHEAFDRFSAAIDAINSSTILPEELLSRATGDVTVLDAVNQWSREAMQATSRLQIDEIAKMLGEDQFVDTAARFSGIYDPALYEKQLARARGGMIPNNVIYAAIFDEALGPNATADEIRRIANELASADPKSVYELGLYRYNMKYRIPFGRPPIGRANIISGEFVDDLQGIPDWLIADLREVRPFKIVEDWQGNEIRLTGIALEVSDTGSAVLPLGSKLTPEEMNVLGMNGDRFLIYNGRISFGQEHLEASARLADELGVDSQQVLDGSPQFTFGGTEITFYHNSTDGGYAIPNEGHFRAMLDAGIDPNKKVYAYILDASYDQIMNPEVYIGTVGELANKIPIDISKLTPNDIPEYVDMVEEGLRPGLRPRTQVGFDEGVLPRYERMKSPGTKNFNLGGEQEFEDEGWTDVNIRGGFDIEHNLENIPWPMADNEADNLMASDAMGQFWIGEETADEIDRVLKPGGRFIYYGGGILPEDIEEFGDFTMEVVEALKKRGFELVDMERAGERYDAFIMEKPIGGIEGGEQTTRTLGEMLEGVDWGEADEALDMLVEPEEGTIAIVNIDWTTTQGFDELLNKSISMVLGDDSDLTAVRQAFWDYFEDNGYRWEDVGNAYDIIDKDGNVLEAPHKVIREFLESLLPEEHRWTGTASGELGFKVAEGPDELLEKSGNFLRDFFPPEGVDDILEDPEVSIWFASLPPDDQAKIAGLVKDSLAEAFPDMSYRDLLASFMPEGFVDEVPKGYDQLADWLATLPEEHKNWFTTANDDMRRSYIEFSDSVMANMPPDYDEAIRAIAHDDIMNAFIEDDTERVIRLMDRLRGEWRAMDAQGVDLFDGGFRWSGREYYFGLQGIQAALEGSYEGRNVLGIFIDQSGNVLSSRSPDSFQNMLAWSRYQQGLAGRKEFSRVFETDLARSARAYIDVNGSEIRVFAFAGDSAPEDVLGEITAVIDILKGMQPEDYPWTSQIEWGVEGIAIIPASGTLPMVDTGREAKRFFDANFALQRDYYDLNAQEAIDILDKLPRSEWYTIFRKMTPIQISMAYSNFYGHGLDQAAKEFGVPTAEYIEWLRKELPHEPELTEFNARNFRAAVFESANAYIKDVIGVEDTAGFYDMLYDTGFLTKPNAMSTDQETTEALIRYLKAMYQGDIGAAVAGTDLANWLDTPPIGWKWIEDHTGIVLDPKSGVHFTPGYLEPTAPIVLDLNGHLGYGQALQSFQEVAGEADKLRLIAKVSPDGTEIMVQQGMDYDVPLMLSQLADYVVDPTTHVRIRASDGTWVDMGTKQEVLDSYIHLGNGNYIKTQDFTLDEVFDWNINEVEGFNVHARDGRYAIVYDVKSGRIAMDVEHDIAFGRLFPNAKGASLPEGGSTQVIEAMSVPDAATYVKNASGDPNIRIPEGVRGFVFLSDVIDEPDMDLLRKLGSGDMDPSTEILMASWDGGKIQDLGRLDDLLKWNYGDDVLPGEVSVYNRTSGEQDVFHLNAYYDYIREEPQAKWAWNWRNKMLILGDPQGLHADEKLLRYGPPDDWIPFTKDGNVIYLDVHDRTGMLDGVNDFLEKLGIPGETKVVLPNGGEYELRMVYRKQPIRPPIRSGIRGMPSVEILKANQDSLVNQFAKMDIDIFNPSAATHGGYAAILYDPETGKFFADDMHIYAYRQFDDAEGKKFVFGFMQIDSEDGNKIGWYNKYGEEMYWAKEEARIAPELSNEEDFMDLLRQLKEMGVPGDFEVVRANNDDWSLSMGTLDELTPPPQVAMTTNPEIVEFNKGWLASAKADYNTSLAFDPASGRFAITGDHYQSLDELLLAGGVRPDVESTAMLAAIFRILPDGRYDIDVLDTYLDLKVNDENLRAFAKALKDAGVPEDTKIVVSLNPNEDWEFADEYTTTIDKLLGGGGAGKPPELPPAALEGAMEEPGKPKWRIFNFSDPKGIPNKFRKLFKMRLNGFGKAEGSMIGIYTMEGQLWWSGDLQFHGPILKQAGKGLGQVGTFVLTPNGELVMSALSYDHGKQFVEAILREGGAGAEAMPARIVLVAEDEAWPHAGREWRGSLGEFVGRELPANQMHTDVIAEMMDDARRMMRAELSEKASEDLNDIYLALQAWERNARDMFETEGQAAATRAEDYAAKRKMVSEAKAAWMEGLHKASMYGVSEVNRILFDYAVHMNAEEMLRYYAPFTTWQLRNPLFWAQALGKKPNVVNHALAFYNASEVDRRKRGLSERFKGTVGMDVGSDNPLGLPGGYYATSPSPFASILSQFKQPFETPEQAEWQPQDQARKVAQQLVQGSQSLGITPWPWMQLALEKGGVTAPGTTQFSLGPQERLLEMGLQKLGLMDPGETMFGMNDTSKFIIDYNTNRRISEMEAMGMIDHTTALAAMKNPEDPIWQQANAEVMDIMNMTGLAGLLTPFSVKYASEGEQTIRQIKANSASLTPEEKEWLKIQFPYLETYSLVFGDQQQLELARVYNKYEIMMEGQHPWEPGYKQLVADRSKELDALYGPQQTSEELLVQYTHEPIEIGGEDAFGNIVDEEGARWSTLHRLRDVEPRASEFADELGNINWDEFNAELDRFNESIETVSAELGVPITAEDYIQFRYRNAMPDKVAYDQYKKWRETAWDYYESIQVGGRNFHDAILWAADMQYMKDLQAGFTLWEADILRNRNRIRWTIDGMPYVYSSKLLEPYTMGVRMSRFAQAVANIQGLSEDETKQFAVINAQLNHTLPGMFGEVDSLDRMRNAIYDYYYDRLLPDEQRQVRQFLGMEEGFILPKDPGEVIAVFSALEGIQDLSALAGYGTIGLTENFTVPFPPWASEITPEERTELDQARVDLFRYWTAKDAGVGGTWTDILTKYYSNPNSPQSKFWGALSGASLGDAAFDDPVISPFMSKAARDTIGFTDAQYTAALDYLMKHWDSLIDKEMTAIIQEHPDWYERAQAERAEFDKLKVADMEYWKSIYYGVYWKERDAWTAQHADTWSKLEPYIDRERARALQYPYYAFFYKQYDYGKYYGRKDPNEIEKGAPKLSQDFMQAIDDMNAYIGGGGKWTDLMSTFFGPKPVISLVDKSQ